MGWLTKLHRAWALCPSLVVACFSFARSVDHHLLGYGLGLDSFTCLSTVPHTAVFKLLSLWLKEVILVICTGGGGGGPELGLFQN